MHTPLSSPQPDERPVAALRRYLTGSYLPTLMHALFHLMAVTLAFIMASAWTARDSDLKDLRDKLALLPALLREANSVRLNLEESYKDGLPASCPDTFLIGGKELRFKTPVWHSLFTSRYALIIGNELYTEIQQTVDELENAPVVTQPYGRSDCEAFVQERVAGLATLVTHLNKAKAGTQQEYDGLQKRLWPSNFDRPVAITLAVWVLIMLSPALGFGAELAWRSGLRPRLGALGAAVLYTRALGVALLTLVGVEIVRTRALSASAPLAPQTFLHLAAGVLAAYAGFFGIAPLLVARILGPLFTLAGVLELAAPGALSGSRSPATAPAGGHLGAVTLLALLHLAIGALGTWVGFRAKPPHRRPRHA